MRDKRVVTLLIVCVLGAMLAMALIAYAIFGGGNEDTPNPEQTSANETALVTHDV
ncbi:MAG: hypothetical protein N2C12_02000 [Planctomycetales bacterium]